MLSEIRGWKFPVQVDKDTGKIMTVEDNENVKQSVKIILQTQVYERKIVPEFGTNIRSYMFEVVDPSFIQDIKRSITGALKKWESHILDLNVMVKADGGPISTINTDIDYVTDIIPVQERVTKQIKMDASE